MSESKEDGGAAFPTSRYVELRPDAHRLVHDGGMSLRDYFAAAALQGFCADQNLTSWTTEQTAKHAYAYADALLKARQS